MCVTSRCYKERKGISKGWNGRGRSKKNRRASWRYVSRSAFTRSSWRFPQFNARLDVYFTINVDSFGPLVNICVLVSETLKCFLLICIQISLEFSLFTIIRFFVRVGLQTLQTNLMQHKSLNCCIAELFKNRHFVIFYPVSVFISAVSGETAIMCYFQFSRMTGTCISSQANIMFVGTFCHEY